MFKKEERNYILTQAWFTFTVNWGRFVQWASPDALKGKGKSPSFMSHLKAPERKCTFVDHFQKRCMCSWQTQATLIHLHFKTWWYTQNKYICKVHEYTIPSTIKLWVYSTVSGLCLSDWHRCDESSRRWTRHLELIHPDHEQGLWSNSILSREHIWT